LAQSLPGLHIEIVKRSDRANGFGMLPKHWILERSIAWSNRCRTGDKIYGYIGPDTAVW